MSSRWAAIRSGVARSVLVATAILVGSCKTLEPTTCGSDKDCKLQRVCDLGKCVWSPSSAEARALPPSSATYTQTPR